MDILDKNNKTICQVLIRIYKKMVIEEKAETAEEVLDCIIMAKKMHKRLVELKFPDMKQDGEDEGIWRKEIMDLYNQRESWL